MAETDLPSPANRTMRARRWNRAWPHCRRVIAWSAFRSLWESSSSMPRSSANNSDHLYRNLWRAAL